jgi:Ser/Thr protein kinase RdoA (MazF antagonist)
MGGRAHLLNLSENHTFRIDTSIGERFILRVHRPGYQTAATIDSELEWLAALRVETDLPLPKPLPGRDGRLRQTLNLPGEAPRQAVLFAFVAGNEPSFGGALRELFQALGRFAAIAHRHALSFRPSPGFVRPKWDAAAILDAGGLWGNWRTAPGVTGPVATALAAVEARLRAELAAYGQGSDRFGLIHADMRLANLLVDGDRVTLIDFDDCGFGWFMYDFAAAVSFHEIDPALPGLRQSWLAGYRQVRPLAMADEAMLETMVLLRRMALLAWIGSHGETDLARAQAPGFAAATAALAAPWLAGCQSVSRKGAKRPSGSET